MPASKNTFWYPLFDKLMRKRRVSELNAAMLSFPSMVSDDELQLILEELLSNIVKEYVLYWYLELSNYPVFPRIIGDMLAQSFIVIKTKYLTLDISEILLTDVVQLFKQHLQTYHTSKDHYSDFPSHSLDSYFHSIKPHPAIDNEKSYIREYAKRIAQHCLNDADLSSSSVFLLTVDTIAFVIESIIETLSNPSMIYTLLMMLFDGKSDSIFKFDPVSILQMLKNGVRPKTPRYYHDLMDIFDMIFKCKSSEDPNEYQVIWTTYFTLIEPIICGLIGDYIDSVLVAIVDQTFTIELLSKFLNHLNDLLFRSKTPKPFVLDEDYEFIPYGKQRRDLSDKIQEYFPKMFSTSLGGPDRVKILLDRQLLAVFASKQRNKHLMYGILDIIVHHFFPTMPKRTESIKQINSHLKIPDQVRSHRQSYSTSVGQSYKEEHLRRKL